MKRVLHFLFAAVLAALLVPAFGQVAPDYSKTGSGRAAVLLAASASAVIIPSSGSSNATGQITITTAQPAQPVGTVGLFLPAGVVTAGSQGTGAAVYQATCSSTTVCQLTGTGIVTGNAAYTQVITEAALATVTIPAGAMGLNGGVEIRTVWTVTNSANSKTLRARLGGAAGTQFMQVPVTTVAIFSDIRRIRNRNSAASQVGSISAGGFSTGTAGAAVVTGTVDTAASADLVISGQLALATETTILETYEVWLLP